MTTNYANCDDQSRTYTISYSRPIAYCQYREDCCDVDTDKCKRCANNRKRSYFRPVDSWGYWQYPCYTITWSPATGDDLSFTTGDDSWSTSSHFVEAK